MAALANLALVTLGHGPRPEYEAMFSASLAAAGLSPAIRAYHILDALAPAAIAGLAAAPAEPAILSRVRGPDGVVANRALSRARLMPLIEAAIDAAAADGADATVVCVAEYLPLADRPRPALLPFGLLARRLRALAAPDEPVALCAYGDRQRAQQTETWAAFGGIAAPRLRFFTAVPDAAALIAGIKAAGIGYGAVLAFAYAISDAASLEAFDAAQAATGCTVLLPIRVTVEALAQGAGGRP